MLDCKVFWKLSETELMLARYTAKACENIYPQANIFYILNNKITN